MKTRARVFILFIVVMMLLIGFGLYHHFNPNVERAISSHFHWMKDVKVVETAWFRDKGFIVFTHKGKEPQTKDVCTAFVNRRWIGLKISVNGCTSYKNNGSYDFAAKTTFDGRPFIYGMTGVAEEMTSDGKSLSSVRYGNMKIWYAFYDQAKSARAQIESN